MGRAGSQPFCGHLHYLSYNRWFNAKVNTWAFQYESGSKHSIYFYMLYFILLDDIVNLKYTVSSISLPFSLSSFNCANVVNVIEMKTDNFSAHVP